MKQSISTPIQRVDGPAKIRGEAIYIDDMHFENRLYAKTLRSDRAKAKIIGIRIPELPEGYFIVDKNDVPGVNRMRTVVSDHPIFADDTVEYIGQPILLVVGPERETIWNILTHITVDYKDLKLLATLEEAEVQGTVFTDYHYNKGNPDNAFTEATTIIEDEYRTGYQEHVYLEPQGMTAEYRDNTMFVYGSMQCPFYAEGALTEALGWDAKRIRVIQTVTGGAFGGKEEFPSLTACQVAVAALKTKQPVALIYDRDEDIICSTKRHPSIVRYKAALNQNNDVIALDIDVLL
ncbi:MAG: molybdopterin-dependent oxidoreductase, partial [Candidatus Marinimicrobia bacterium]|nr:molybdopterin-dependent oxidoreductase [Candidatus Neomarinimicrobiota bacterium]